MRKEFRDRLATFFWKLKLPHCGNDLHLKRGCRFYKTRFIQLGNGIRIGRDCDFYAHPRDIDETVLTIGNHCHIGHRANLAAIESVVIEDKVVMGNDVYIADHGHAYEDADVPVIDQPVSKSRPVKIGEGSWIGAKAVILPGVTVGKHAVVGASSVVTHNVEAYTVVAGNPATVIKRYDETTKEWIRV